MTPQIGAKIIVKMCLGSSQVELSDGRLKYTKKESPWGIYPPTTSHLTDLEGSFKISNFDYLYT